MKRSTYTLRRLLALVLVLVMVGALFAGCNNTPDPTDPPEPSATTQQTDAPTDPTEEPTEEPTDAPTEPPVTVPPVVMGTVNADNLNVRSEPYSTADILKRLAINTRIEIEEQKIVDGVNWGRIAEGWINLNYVTIDGEGTGTGTVIDNDNNIGNGTVNTDVNKTYTGVISTTELHIREDADADSKSVGTYKKGDKVTIIGQRDGWGKTDKGWINMKYVDLNGTSSSTGSGSSSNSGSTAGSNTTVVSNGNKVALGTGTVTGTTSLAIRSGPGTNYAWLSFVREGETHSYYQKSGNWVRLQKGWVNSNYMDLEYAIAAGTQGTVNTDALHVRKEADADSDSLTTVKKGDKVTILEVKGTWGKVEYETGKFGWLNLDYVKFTTASSTYTIGEYTITADSLHIRKEADADSTALGTYSKGDKVTVTAIDGNWGKTDKGWINLKYADMTASYSTGTGKVTASSLNVRSKPSTKGDDLGSLKKGDSVTILEVDGNWGKIDFNGKTGWISLNYVEMDPAAKYAVTIDSAITGGKVSTSSASYTKGSVVTLTITPDSGKALATLTVKDASGNAVTVKDNKFTMPASKVTVTATFTAEAVKYTVTVNSDPAAGGKVAASVTTAAKGTEVVLTVTPNSGYVLEQLTAMNTTNNTTVAVSGNKFTMPEGNVNVVAKFKETKETTYAITSSSDRVAVSTSSAVAGDTITLTITPVDGYVLEELIVKNTSDNSNISVSGSGNTRTFTMPAAKVTVAATFKEVTYGVTINAAAGGSVSCDKNVYKKGETVNLTVTPADGYKLTKLVANDTDITSSSAFVMPASNVTVTATFEKASYAVTVNAATHGKVTADKSSAEKDTLITLTITPDAGYELDKLEIKKGTAEVTKESANTFKMPAGDVTVTATFKYTSVKYTVSNANGTTVNIRESADVNSKVLGTIDNGTEIASLEGSTNAWIKVTHNNITGFVGVGNLTKKG